jgi:hypothetical protein
MAEKQSSRALERQVQIPLEIACHRKSQHLLETVDNATILTRSSVAHTNNDSMSVTFCLHMHRSGCTIVLGRALP